MSPRPPASGTVDGLLTAPDDLLATRAGEGDEEAFAILMRRHSRLLLALALHTLGNLQDAEDAVQDAFISAWRRLPEFRHACAFSTWIYRITVNRCLNSLRRRPAPVPLNGVAEPTAGVDSSPAQAAEEDALASALADALGALEPRQRVCWILRELHGLPYEQIAQVTGTSQQTVRGRLYRARRSLKEMMGPWR
ncbi:RNA polymerase sigma factor [Streptomyces sp. NBC_01445]|uniref:RNA polymerase sigma factor n=1 Tax=Streptomyces sp. NBC_01445 TaxID=2903869 RepID=UPI002DD8CAF6|nr:sigma-70 family RNA polymerase sigma factor [Streptomyces sp. NBC_01445]WSE10501.1 sigma-70 family RNA polymerase sigma factor [Streptomyces sp. NBC_01445]